MLPHFEVETGRVLGSNLEMTSVLDAPLPTACGLSPLFTLANKHLRQANEINEDVSFSLSVDGTVSVYPAVTSDTPGALKKQQTVSAASIAHVLLLGTKLMDSWYICPPSSSSSSQSNLPPGLVATTSFVQLFVKVTPAPAVQLETDLAALQLTSSQLATATRIG
ncbi:unnamed protein product, partial [Dibothriocephalus latus]